MSAGGDNWVIITGASSGIGRALALEFAAGGYHVFLTGRDMTALTDVAAKCAKEHGVQTEVVPADLSSSSAVDDLIEAILSKPRRYEILVNNAGFGIHGNFASTDVDANIRLVNVQLIAMLRLTRAVLPDMTSRRSGRILNVASVYSFVPVPFQSVYGACKAFMLSFSSSLQNEVREMGITVTVFCPGVTQTAFRSRAGVYEKREDAGMTAESAARIAYVKTLQGTHIVVPGLINRIFVFLSQVLPNNSIPSIMRFINRQRGHNHS